MEGFKKLIFYANINVFPVYLLPVVSAILYLIIINNHLINFSYQIQIFRDFSVPIFLYFISNI